MASDKSKKSLDTANATTALTHKDVKHLRELVAELTRQNETLAELVKAYAKQNKRHAKQLDKAASADGADAGSRSKQDEDSTKISKRAPNGVKRGERAGEVEPVVGCADPPAWRRQATQVAPLRRVDSRR
jgi:hypothetical protein